MHARNKAMLGMLVYMTFMSMFMGWAFTADNTTASKTLLAMTALTIAQLVGLYLYKLVSNTNGRV